MHELEKLICAPWSAVYTQAGILTESKNPSFFGCSVGSFLVLSEVPILVYVEDVGAYKQVDLKLGSSVDHDFGKEAREVLFHPPRKRVNVFPESCRIDLLLNSKIYVVDEVDVIESGEIFRGVILEGDRGNFFGIIIDENITTNLLLTTDAKTIDMLRR